MVYGVAKRGVMARLRGDCFHSEIVISYLTVSHRRWRPAMDNGVKGRNALGTARPK